MQEILIEFLHNVMYVYSNSRDLTFLFQTVTEKLDRMESNDLKKLLVFTIDDYMITQVGEKWLMYLLEKYYYKTRVGGQRFYENLNEYIQTKNVEMVRLYALGLKFGFKGNGQVSSDIQEQINHALYPERLYITPKGFFRPQRHMDKPKGFGVFFVPVVIVFTVLNIIDLLYVKDLSLYRII